MALSIPGEPPVKALREPCRDRGFGPEPDLIAQASNVGDEDRRLVGPLRQDAEPDQLRAACQRAEFECKTGDGPGFAGGDIDGSFDFPLDERRQGFADIARIEKVAYLST